MLALSALFDQEADFVTVLTIALSVIFRLASAFHVSSAVTLESVVLSAVFVA